MDRKLYEQAVELRHELHRHPELSNHEVQTKALLMTFLRQNTSLEIVDRGTWFYAKYSSVPAGRKLMFRADFDALPIDETIDLPYGSETQGVSHKCGHDGHSATLAAFAVEVDRFGAENTIYFLFQHAEETGDGAKICSSLIDEEGIEEVFGYHNQPGYPIGEVIVNEGSFQCASEGMSLYFKGVPSHASDPGAGRNPAEAIARMICALPKLYCPEDFDGLVLATVVHVEVGALAFGTAAGEGVLRITLRGEREEEMKCLEQRIDSLAYRLASAYGLEYSAVFCDVFPECWNHPESVCRIRAVCEERGIPLHAYPHPKRGSEDFGHYTKAAKGALFNVGAGNITAHHTVTFDFPDEIIPVAAAIFEGLAGMRQR